MGLRIIPFLTELLNPEFGCQSGEIMLDKILTNGALEIQVGNTTNNLAKP